jgi:peroxin-16
MNGLLKSYDEFVMKNAPLITSVENSFRSLSYILPGRFQDAAIVSEVIYGLVSIFKWYNDSVFFEKMPAMNGGIAWNEYIRLLERASPIAGHAMRLYNLMRMGQIPMEMLIERILGFEQKLLFCFLTEASKYFRIINFFA